MSVQEGLQSTDVSVIKMARSVAKGKVTKNLKELKSALVYEGGTFVHDDIEEADVKKYHNSLRIAHDEFQELHERYISFADLDPTIETLVRESEEKYSSDVRLSVTEVNRLHSKYVNSKKKMSDASSYEMKTKSLECMVRFMKESLECKVNAAKDLIKSEDDNVRKAARSVKKDIRSCFESYDAKVNEYLMHMLGCKESEPKYSEISGFRSIVVKEIESLSVELEAIAISSGSVGIVDSDRKYETMVKLQKLSCPKFSGIPRDFGNFKRDFDQIVNVSGRADVEIGSNLRDAIPEKFKHLVSHLDTSNHVEMMSILEKKFGTKSLVIQDIVSQLDKMKPITSDRMFIEFVEKLQKIKLDLDSLNQTNEVANASCMGKIEDKLPLAIGTDWWKEVVAQKLDECASLDRYKALMKFLDEAKERVERQTTSLNRNVGPGAAKAVTNCVTGSITLSSFARNNDKKTERQWNNCLACDVDGATDLRSIQHPMESCGVWKSLSQKEKEKKVKCVKHPFKDDHTTQTCTVTGRKCKFCSKDTHHFLLCPKPVAKSSSNTTTLTATSVESMSPVLVQSLYVSAPDGSKIGSLLDLCSTDDYVTHRYAQKMHLVGEDVELLIEGMGGKETYCSTKLYMVPIMVAGSEVVVPCYGIEKITSDVSLPESDSYNRLCRKFDVKPRNVKRPSSIDLLLSMRQNHIHPSAIKNIGNMMLYKGPLGMVFGGSDDDLNFDPPEKCYPSTVHVLNQSSLRHAQTMRTIVKEADFSVRAKADKEFIDYFKEDSIGVHCNPRCGSCKCGTCPIGAKEMSLKDEREYERFKSLMVLDTVGTEVDPGPYWVSELPWTVDRYKLINNKPAVLGVMRSTIKKLDKDPLWREIYDKQLMDLIEKGFAREVSDEEVESWIENGGVTYYISHQIAVNPSSNSTPFRVVFNSSQKYKGYSLNTSWDLGPDVMNNLHGVLMRFRNDRFAAQGDVTKMFYMIRIPKSEQMMQLFLWKFPGEEKIRAFCMNHLVMGNRP